MLCRVYLAHAISTLVLNQLFYLIVIVDIKFLYCLKIEEELKICILPLFVG